MSSLAKHTSILKLVLNLAALMSTQVLYTTSAMTSHENKLEKLRIHFVTWNVATKDPDEDLHSLLNLSGEKTQQNLPDMYIIGLQEVRSQVTDLVKNILAYDPWTQALRETLREYNYVKIHTTKMQGIIINAFALRKHLPHLRLLEWKYTKTGFSGFWGNKGGVSIRMDLYGINACFVNTHLPAHDEALQSRIDDYDTIMKSHLYDNMETKHIIYHDYVFWIGDLNFRLDEGLSAADIELLVKKKDLETLLKKDQLSIIRNSHRAFTELIEDKITFPPTYKYEFGTQEFDLKRRPSWTDRILHKVNPVSYVENHLKAVQLSYTSHPSYTLSDHKPVTAEFDIFIKPNFTEDSVTLTVPNWYLEEENSVSYQYEGGYESHPSDYIALYHNDFDTIEDYIFFEYVKAPNRDESTEHKVTFPFIAARSSGTYRLIYFSEKKSALSILGVSCAFSINQRNEETVQSCIL